MRLTSLAFQDHGIIPSRYTCEGANVNPPLTFHDIPAGTQSLALIMDDPDVPHHVRPDGMWDHWVLFNIDPSVTEVSDSSTPPCVVGLTTFGHTRYGGPCPPNGEHRYFFKLYALNCRLNLPERSNKHAVEKAMQGHVLAECSLMGRYEKNKGY